MRIALWIVQGLLAALFLFAGGIKFTIPFEEMTVPGGIPGEFILFIGAAEVLGALGLILPGLTKIRPSLTPLAAAGLAIIMIGATVLALAFPELVGGGDPSLASIPFVIGLLTAFVAYGRYRVAPHGSRRRTQTVAAVGAAA
jgi:hypothetical protein